MRKFLFCIFFSLLSSVYVFAQIGENYNQITDDGRITSSADRHNGRDSLGGNKEIPRGLKVWTVDRRFGDRFEATPDTMQHLYMNSIFTNGLYGEYNTLGNLGSPRHNRIFVDSYLKLPNEFIFTDPYDYFLTPVEDFHFTNTLSPITNLNYNTCGSGMYGEDHVKVLFANNAGKKLGFGMKFDYLYGKGYYQNSNSAHFNYTFYGSYLGDRYQAHLLVALNHQKNSENGGITNDEFILHPESFSDNYSVQEIPVVLSSNWNRNDSQHLFFTHRYSFGFNRKVPMTEEEKAAKKFAIEARKDNAQNNAMKKAIEKARKEQGDDFDEEEFREELKRNPSLLEVQEEAAVDTSWTKNEYVPVTSFIHTADFSNHKRIYQAYESPRNYYLNTYYDGSAEFGGYKYSGDSIYDLTKYYSLKNTFAVAMLEGFNKWVPMGLKLFAAHELRHYTLPNIGNAEEPASELPRPFMQGYNEHDISVGGQLQKTLGTTFHYNVSLETWLAGSSAGDVELEGTGDMNLPLFGDTVSLAVKAGLSRVGPSFYYDTFHSKHLWWDNSLTKQTNMHLEGMLNIEKTRTKVRVAVDEIKDYAYFASKYTLTKDFGREGNTVSVVQSSDIISLLTMQLTQRCKLGPLNLEAQATYQKSSHKETIPLPDLNLYANLYLDFKIARVLSTELGADVRYFTAYNAPEYVPMLGMFCVQDNAENNVKVGNYPMVNVYANFHLKHARFFVMMSHVNATAGNYFMVPHYPQNQSLFRFGVSWNFFN